VGSGEDPQQLLGKRGTAAAHPPPSGDLGELGRAKTPRGYLAPEAPVARFAPAALREEKLRRTLRNSALSVRPAGSLVVVKTPPATAHPGARALDRAAVASVVGPLAGRDTG